RDPGDLGRAFVLDHHLPGFQGEVGAGPVAAGPLGVDGAQFQRPHLLPSQSASRGKSLYPPAKMCGTMFAFTLRQKGGRDVPNTRSAEKRVRVTAKRTLRNRMIRSRMKTAIRKYQAAVNEGNLQTATELFRRSEEHTSELQSRENLVCRLLLEKK